ncbi:circadian locomoter output cycles protein kaput-like [Uloborus diversus]|uniref:circadian locomoter output cycles protein kaput-like n=1 Tax=Uloborus diversus TaxID=327109 RepID=UPI00240A2DFA|nr:circadian locomoter output cycles protein kaput-like [Uloborus diversus]
MKDSADSPTTMHKSRNLSEKKRRDQFNMLINELCSMVTSTSRKMDKSSVLRATISFLKNHSELSVQSQSVEVEENWKPSFLSNEEFTHLMLEALDGFIIVFSCNGQILYTSESTASLLGYLPSRFYSSVFDFIHEVDKSSLYKLISNAPSTSNNSLSKDSFVSILLHMKRGPIHSQSNCSYELVNLIGTFFHWPSSFEGSSQISFDCDSNSCSSICSPLASSAVEWRSCFVAIGRLQTPHLLRVVNLSDESKKEFTSRHSLEWKFLFLDHRAPPIIGYLPFEVLGTSGYDYYHVDDLDNIAASHELLMQTGEGTSCFYRFLTKGQQWIWLQTRYYISYHQWNSKPEFIVCTHTVISGEKVLKSHQDVPKKFPKRPSSVTQMNTPPSQSACMSPSPSASSLGSLSSEHSEQCSSKATSSNMHMNSVLYSNQRSKEKSYSTLNQVPPLVMTETFLEPHPHLAAVQSSPQMGNDMSFISSPNASPISPQTTLEPTSHVLLSRGQQMPQVANSNMPATQFQKDQSPQSVNPNQVQHMLLLRQRQQQIQRQIMMQQEELRMVSEQLQNFSQFVPPGASVSTRDIPYQTSESSTSNYVNSYVMTQPQLQVLVPTSAESMMKSVDSFPKSAQSSITSRTYMNLEPDMCTVGTSERISYLPSDQNSEMIAQAYQMPHNMPPNT